MPFERAKNLTFTAFLDDDKPIKNDEPPHKVVTTMKVPRWEYAKLVRDSATLETVKQLVKGMESYNLKNVLDVLLKVNDEADG